MCRGVSQVQATRNGHLRKLARAESGRHPGTGVQLELLPESLDRASAAAQCSSVSAAAAASSIVVGCGAGEGDSGSSD
eukprot:4193007-Pyramimonas_sp.AAC.1